MNVTIGRRPNPIEALDRLSTVLAAIPGRIVACSGGIDSLVLATVAHRSAPDTTTIAHTVTPAVPGDGTARVVAFADREGWNLDIVRSREFDDERYLANPADRCYYCKSNLYDAIAELTPSDADGDRVILSGANVDDLGEYRPGLVAAAERTVRHPYVEAGVTKAEIRAIARQFGLAEADLPSSPCLASRLYTGTRVTAERLRAVEAGEAMVTASTGIEVVRCRIRHDGTTVDVLVEVAEVDRHLVTIELLDRLTASMRVIEPSIGSVALDERAYRPGRAFVDSTGTQIDGAGRAWTDPTAPVVSPSPGETTRMHARPAPGLVAVVESNV